MKKVIIAGGSGFIGQHLSKQLISNGYEVVILSRSSKAQKNGISYRKWNGKSLDDWSSELDGSDALINLAGKNINCRFTSENRKAITKSRIDSVNILQEAIQKCKNPPNVWIQSSSIGIYGNTKDEVNEKSPRGKGFLADVTEAWENSFFGGEKVIRKAALRIGVVLGKNGGALEPLEKLVKMFLGGAAGKGDQYISWIHIDDLTAIIIETISNERYEGIINAVAPVPLQNKNFMAILRKVYNRPWSPPAPNFAVKLGANIMGTESSLILDSSRVIPLKLRELNYSYTYSSLEPAIRSLL